MATGRLFCKRTHSAMADEEKPLRKIAESFKDLANAVTSQSLNNQLEIAPFSHACSLVSPLFRCLGIAFKFAEMDYVSKVDDLLEASKSIMTIQMMMDKDIEGNCVKRAGSHTRNLLRVKRGLDMVKACLSRLSLQMHDWKVYWLGVSMACSILRLLRCFPRTREGIICAIHFPLYRQYASIKVDLLSGRGNSLKNPASTAYAQVFSPYHGWAIRKAVSAGMYALPQKHSS